MGDRTHRTKDTLTKSLTLYIRNTVNGVLLTRPLSFEIPNITNKLRGISEEADNRCNRFFKEHPEGPFKENHTPAHFLNRSGPKILEMLLWMHGKHVVYPKVLDLCAAPGGFVNVLSGWSLELDYMFFKGSTPLLPMSKVLPPSARLISTNSIQVFANECLSRAPMYDLITADGACGPVYDPNGQKAFKDIVTSELSVIRSLLKVGGDAIVKIFCYKHVEPSHVCVTMSSMFEEVYAIKPNFSRLTNTELYLIGSNRLSIEREISGKIEDNMSFYMATTWKGVVDNLVLPNTDNHSGYIDNAFVNDLSLLQCILKSHEESGYRKSHTYNAQH